MAKRRKLTKKERAILWYEADGKYRSARQAGIAAGFVKDVKRISMEIDPKKIANRLKSSLSPIQIQELISLLKEP